MEGPFHLRIGNQMDANGPLYILIGCLGNLPGQPGKEGPTLSDVKVTMENYLRM